MTRTALVTGASGFIGSTLVGALARARIHPVALLRKHSSQANLAGLDYSPVEGDFEDPRSLERVVKDVDFVFHVAGVTTAPSRERFFHDNAAGTRNLAVAVARVRPEIRKFVYVSSLAAAGPSTSASAPRVESDRCTPVSDYGWSKLAGEHAILEFKEHFPVCIVRPPMVYGPRDRGFFTFVRSVGRYVVPVLEGRTRTRDKYFSIVFSEDVCQGIIQAALARTSEVPSGEIFYLGSDEICTYREIIDAIAVQLGRTPLRLGISGAALQRGVRGLTVLAKLTGKPFALNHDIVRQLLPDYWICSSEKGRQRLGYSPKCAWSEGIAETMRWYRRHNWI